MRAGQYRFAIPLALVAVCAVAAISPWQPSVPQRRAIGLLQPQLSPDGESIVGAYQGDIWRLPRAGGTMRRLTATASWDTDPTWSPDGKRIAFFAAGALAIIDADTGAVLLGNATPRTKDAAAERSPKPIYGTGSLQYDHEGRRLLGKFTLPDAGSQSPLSWFDLQARQLEPVRFDREIKFKHWLLPADGASIVLLSNRDVRGEQGGSNGPQTDLWRVSSAGGTLRKIGEFPARISSAALHGDKLIAATNLGGAHQDLWEVPLDNPLEPARKLTFGQADEAEPSVAGGWLLYSDNHRGATSLVTRDLSTDEERTLTITALDFGRPVGKLRLTFVDKDSGREFAARVSVQGADGVRYAPAESLYRVVDGLEFISPGSSQFDVPAGDYRVRAHHGPDYKVKELSLSVRVDETTTATVEIERWTNPAARGFYSGETHIHANYGSSSVSWYVTPQNVRPLIEAEDLHVANFMVANSDSDGVYDREFFRGAPDPVSDARHILYWNEEFRATLWGHMTLLNLKRLVEPIFTGFADTTNPWDIPTNAEIADHAHLQGGHVDYTHPAFDVKDLYLAAYSAKELPVDVALGKIDSMGINNNGFDTYTPSVELWHRLLNCGFHLAPSAGTDSFMHLISGGLPGSVRSYVKIDGELTYAAWIAGLKAGRSFVSSGPQLEFDSGRAINLGQAERRRFKARVTSPVALERFELIYNGKPIATGAIAVDGMSATIDHDVLLDRSGWIAVRAFAGKLQAHAAPAYIAIAGHPAGSRADAEYFLKWIDRLQAQMEARERIPVASPESNVDPDLRARVVAQLDAARAVYRAIAARSEY